MWKNYLTVALRGLRRRPGYTFINVAGLSVGLACVVLIGLFVAQERRFDRFHTRLDRLYRVNAVTHALEGGEDNANGAVGWPVGDRLAADFPEVEDVIHVRSWGAPIKLGGLYQYESMVFADPGLFRSFSFPLIAGDPETALRDPYTLVLTETLAQKYFGTTQAVGKTLLVRDTLAFTVTGVARDVPETSSLQFGIAASFATFRAMTLGEDRWQNAWFDLNMPTYVLLRPGTDAAAFGAKIAALPMQAAGEGLREMGYTMRLALLPMHAQYLHDEGGNGLGPTGNARRLALLAWIGGFVLLIAGINFVNLATGRSMERAREVGVRKVVGSTRGALVRQFLVESGLVCALALVVALGLAMLALPGFNDLTGKHFAPGDMLTLRVLLSMATLGGAVALLAGLYPALVLSRFAPAIVLKGTFRTSSRGVRLRQGLVVVQFALTVALVIATLVIVRQVRYMQQQDLGFDRAQVLVLDASRAPGGARNEQAEAIKAALRANTDVLAVTATYVVPGHTAWKGQVVWPEGRSREQGMGVEYVPADADFARTFGLTFVAGRDFSPTYGTDDATALVLNETAVHEMGFGTPEEAIGKTIDSPSKLPAGTVIGVVGDFHQHGLQEKVAPVVLSPYPAYQHFALRLRPGADVPRAIAAAEDVWKGFFADYPLTYFFLEDAFDQQYRAEVQQAKTFGTFGGLAIAIACLGLFGLAAFTTQQRTKEIGVRKVLGATEARIVLMLSKDYLVLVGLALAVAAPVAYVVMQRWLEGFAYRMSLGPGVFLLAGGFALGLALLTVAGQALRAATADPVRALRSE